MALSHPAGWTASAKVAFRGSARTSWKGHVAGLDTEGGRGVGLRVEIDDERPQAMLGGGAGKTERDGGLAHPALETDH